MDDTVTTIGILCLILVAASAADTSNDDLSERLEKLEKRHARDMVLLEERMEERYARNIAVLEERVEQRYASIIGRLEERVVKLEATNEHLVTENDSNKQEIASLTRQSSEWKQWESDDENEKASSGVGGTGDANPVELPKRKTDDAVSRIMNTENAMNDRKYMNNNRKRALVEGPNIAFTSYIDHDLNNQGPNQVLVFNKVLLNHGNAYNNFSGTFTAPMTGVYSFTFVIGQRDVNEYRATLVVNNQHMVDAVSQTFHLTQDLQGGNTANLMLSQGDIVFVRQYMAVGSRHVEGDANFRTSTFSGFLIYPVETPPNFIGK